MHDRPIDRMALLAASLVLFAALYFGMLWLMGFKYAYFKRRGEVMTITRDFSTISARSSPKTSLPLTEAARSARAGRLPGLSICRHAGRDRRTGGAPAAPHAG